MVILHCLRSVSSSCCNTLFLCEISILCSVLGNICSMADSITASWYVIIIIGCFPPIAFMNDPYTCLEVLIVSLKRKAHPKNTYNVSCYSYKWCESKLMFDSHACMLSRISCSHHTLYGISFSLHLPIICYQLWDVHLRQTCRRILGLYLSFLWSSLLHASYQILWFFYSV